MKININFSKKLYAMLLVLGSNFSVIAADQAGSATVTVNINQESLKKRYRDIIEQGIPPLEDPKIIVEKVNKHGRVLEKKTIANLMYSDQNKEITLEPGIYRFKIEGFYLSGASNLNGVRINELKKNFINQDQLFELMRIGQLPKSYALKVESICNYSDPVNNPELDALQGGTFNPEDGRAFEKKLKEMQEINIEKNDHFVVSYFGEVDGNQECLVNKFTG